MRQTMITLARLSRDRDKAAFVAIDAASGRRTLLAADDDAEFTGALLHPQSRRPQDDAPAP